MVGRFVDLLSQQPVAYPLTGPLDYLPLILNGSQPTSSFFKPSRIYALIGNSYPYRTYI